MKHRFGWWFRAGSAAAAVLLVGAALATAAGQQSGDRTGAIGDELKAGRARNVILLIGDGMGDSEITIARNYAKGAAGTLNMDRLPFTGEYTTYAVEQGTDDVPVYVPDSAATGTAWATGHKTYNNAVSVDPVTGDPLETILELADDAGYRTGNVSTADITDATPAVLGAHVSLRSCQGPADMAACPGEEKPAGLGSIAEQFVDHEIDVLMGGGKARFDQPTYTGETVTDQAVAAGYQLVTDRAEMNAANLQDGPVLGLFAGGNMDLVWTGPLATPYPGPAATTCATNAAYPGSEPRLPEMTAKAISLLDQATKNSNKGFFLQIEGASIDKQNHASNPCGQIGETVAFDRSVALALAYANSHPRTLVIVTADHGHTSQIIEPQSETDHSPGSIATLITADGVEMVINYATNLPGRSQSHTGTEVRVAAQGPQAANVLGVIDQTEVFDIMARALGVN